MKDIVELQIRAQVLRSLLDGCFCDDPHGDGQLCADCKKNIKELSEIMLSADRRTEAHNAALSDNYERSNP